MTKYLSRSIIMFQCIIGIILGIFFIIIGVYIDSKDGRIHLFHQIWYNVHIYEEFGNSVVISYLTKDELVEISEYFEEKIKNARLG